MSEPALRVGMIGCGTVGRAVAGLLRDQAALYGRRLGRPVELVSVLVRDKQKALSSAAVDPDQVTDDPEAFFAKSMSVVIELAGGAGDVAKYVRRALNQGLDVVTANKALLADEGPQLFALAREHGTSIAFEASCGGGIPCVTGLQTGLMANRISGLYGILNGTCNYILTEMSRAGRSYDEALAEAKARGYAEADETLDVSGVDAAQKLAILASLAFGQRIVADDVPSQGIEHLDLVDLHYAGQLGYEIKLLATAETGDGQQDAGEANHAALGVGPCFVHRDELLADVSGTYNALDIQGHAVGHTMFYGQGAGAMPTASAVISDLLSVLSGGYRALFSNLRLTPDLQPPARLLEPADLRSRFYLRINALDAPGVMARVTTILGEANIGLSAVLQHEANAGEMVPVVVITHTARQGDLDHAAAEIAKLDVIEGQPVHIRIIDLPH